MFYCVIWLIGRYYWIIGVFLCSVYLSNCFVQYVGMILFYVVILICLFVCILTLCIVAYDLTSRSMLCVANWSVYVGFKKVYSIRVDLIKLVPYWFVVVIMTFGRISIVCFPNLISEYINNVLRFCLFVFNGSFGYTFVVMLLLIRNGVSDV